MSPSSGKWWDRNPIGRVEDLSAGSAAWNRALHGCRPLAGSFMPSGEQPFPDGLSRRTGGCGGTGGAVNPPPGSGPAASGCAFSRTRGSASQAVRLHPWGLLRNIHVSQSPRTPAPADPLTVGGGHGRSKAVWIISMRYRARALQRQSFGNRPYPAPCDPLRATPCVADFSSRTRSTIEGRPAGSPCRDCQKHGCFCQAPRDGLRWSNPAGHSIGSIQASR